MGTQALPAAAGEAVGAAQPPAPQAEPLPGEPGWTPAPGTRIQQYEVIRPLGAGGMGTVVLARDTRLGRKVAIKLLGIRHPELSQRFVQEARATARCAHENIVVIYEVGEFDGTPFMALEYLQGQSLGPLVYGGKRVPPARAVELVVPVVRALAAAHEQGIVHRDLKPDNVFLTDAGTVKVLDFGIAKVLHGEEPVRAATPLPAPAAPSAPGLTRADTLVGTLAFMSPEQWGAGAVDHRTDIWAVGIMLFYMLAGRHPLEGLVGEQLAVTAELDTPMPRLADAVGDVPPALADVVDRCLRKRKEERFEDALALLRALEPLMPGRAARELKLDESPYTGLASFQEGDADRFFGRSREVAALVHRLRDRPLVAVVGPSGSGKSSFVRAGLVPALKRSGEPWEALVLRPARHPFAALANLIAPLVSSSSSLEDELQEQHRLTERIRTEPGYVGGVLRARARMKQHRILLFVDQFEELYTLVPDADERKAFTACLEAVADDPASPVRVVLSLRSDFLDRTAEDARFLAVLSQGLFFMTPPDRDGLRDALVQPAEMAGYRFETPEIVEDMLAHLAATQGALPLLQFAASKLWESRDPARRQLTLASYREIGGITGALASHADRVLEELSPQSRALARGVLLRLVTPERTRAIVSVEELRELARDGSEVQQLVDQLARARLLVVQTGAGGAATVELVHESLLHTWPTLRRWLDEGQEDAAFLEQLRTAARQWHQKGRDAGLLWTGDMVTEAQRFQRRFRGELGEVPRAFLEAVLKQAARAARRRRVLLVGSTSVLVLLVVASAVALVVIREAQQEAERQAVIAQTRLAEVQAKERERQRAAEEAAAARAQVELANGELLKKNEALGGALQRAEEERTRAALAQQEAERSARAAREAEGRAVTAAQELQALLKKEQARAERLQAQLGSPVIEELK